MEFNPYRRAWRSGALGDAGGMGYIEKPDDCLYNMPWQTREAEPDEYETKLSGALWALFSRGEHELDAIVEGLNGSDVRPPSGERWTKDIFLAEMARLGGEQV